MIVCISLRFEFVAHVHEALTRSLVFSLPTGFDAIFWGVAASGSLFYTLRGVLTKFFLLRRAHALKQELLLSKVDSYSFLMYLFD